MNILQGFNSRHNYCVTLNATEAIDDSKILGVYHYNHPVFSLSSVCAAQTLKDFNGTRHTWFAGAYLGNGFHEDGVLSALNVVEGLNQLSTVSHHR